MINVQKQNLFSSFTRQRYYWLFMTGIWTILSIFMANQLYIGFARGGNPITWYESFLLEIIYCYFWVFLAPVVLWLAKKFPFERKLWYKSIIIHLIAGMFMSSFTMGLRRILFWIILENAQGALPVDKIIKSMFTYFDYGMMSYLLNLLISYAYQYYNNYREKELRTSQLETQLAHAQLQSLKIQLHPHFLFNTLNSIAMLIRKNDNATAIKMLAGLSDFLRYTLNSFNTQEVPLKQELELLELYLNIQQIRFKDRLKIKIDVSPDVMSAQVPNLILQPLVENSIRHGISQISSGGHLDIQAKRDNGMLLINISDDGPGLKDNWQILKHNGIGLINTETRLEKLYGKSYKFELLNNDYGGTSVILEIPFNEK